MTLADEILDVGPNEGRGIRLAAVVLKLNNGMMNGERPLSWNPPIHINSVLGSLPPSPYIPNDTEYDIREDFIPFTYHTSYTQEAVEAIPNLEELDAAWDIIISES